MWLNEGFTVFGERKVSQSLNPDKPDFSKVEASLGNAALYADVMNFGPENTYTSLFPQLKGANPDDAFSEVCYEKGY